MSPATHLLAGWAVAAASADTRRDRALVTLAGVVPDLDGAAMLLEYATRDSAQPIMWYSLYHRALGHNVLAGFLIALVVAALARRRLRAGLLALGTFHLHIAMDLIGGTSPDGSVWSIRYLWPFWPDWEIAWSGQWPLNGWQSVVVTAALIALTLYIAWRRGFSPVEMLSPRADRAVVETLRARFGRRLAREDA